MAAPSTDVREGAPRGGDVREQLRAAWDEMLAQLARAREAIDDPSLYPPPPSERNLAEGYRYLLGFLYGAIDRALSEPGFPQFRRAIQPVDKATIDNADAIYLCAEIDADATYRIRGKAQDHRHWRGAPATTSGRKAPQYVIFEAVNVYAGDTGTLAELAPGARVNTGTLDSPKLRVEADGSFEILLAPERPPGHVGNFIATRSVRPGTAADGSQIQVPYAARYLVLRELFHDWEREDLLDIHIARLGGEGAQPEPLDAAKAAGQMRRIGEIVDHQMRFWNEFYAIILETYEDVNGDGKRFMPRNDLNAPNFATLATGGGQSTNLYAGGVFELGQDEALIVEIHTPIAPAFHNIHLSNLWGESLDFANHPSSLNAFQARPDADGAVRYVIAHRDPGVPNWLDTTGLPEGFVSPRWTYPTKPDRLPTIRATKVAFADIRAHLPAATPSVSPAERREQIRIRQEHVQRRYRQY